MPRDYDRRHPRNRGLHYDRYDDRFDEPGYGARRQGNPDRRMPARGPDRAGGSSGGIPDGLLMGTLALLLGATVLVWTATGLSGLFSHGSWPDGVTFARTPVAIRDLAADPKDIAGAWSDVKPSQLSGYGLFWGLFISQLLIAGVLAIFAVGTVTRARAVRAARRFNTAAGAEETDVRAQPAADIPSPDNALRSPTEAQPEPTLPEPSPRPTPEPAPAPSPQAAPSAIPVPGLELAGSDVDGADPLSRVREAPGAVLVATSDPAVWAATKNARSKLGPVHLFDPGQLCDTPDRLRWSPHHGCSDKSTAATRATALLAPLRSPRPIDAEVHKAAETLLRCWLHAAALDDRPFREVHRWALAKSAPTDPVQTLRTHPKASSGAAGELEATLTGHPERRKDATELVRRALSPLSQLHVRNACTATRADRIALESFIDETGTLYVVGEERELMPILNALTQSVVELGRRMAARSSPGRLDPPLTTVLELPLEAPRLPGTANPPQQLK